MATRYEDLGKRLQELRDAVGITQAQLCRQIGVSTNRWNQYEKGERQITVTVAISLANEFGATLDYIYRADRSGLPQPLRAKLPRAA